VGKIKVRKKLRSKKKVQVSSFSIYGLIALSVLFIFLVFFSMFSSNDKTFKVEPRNDMVKEERKNDSEQYETVGWVRVQGTNIDYPIIHIKDETYGQPVSDKSYAWTDFESGELKNKIDIGGHNILNLGTNPVMKDEMFVYFEELMNFVYSDFAKENQFIQLNVNGEDYIYQIFSVNFLKVFDINKFLRNDQKNDNIADYLEMLNKGNYYNYDIDVNENDKLLSLYTCTRFFGKDLSLNFTVTGRLLRDDEKMKLVNVKETEKYDEIVQVLEGGEEDE
jgi:sortase B